jgi:uncharacterized protein YkwD
VAENPDCNRDYHPAGDSLPGIEPVDPPEEHTMRRLPFLVIGMVGAGMILALIFLFSGPGLSPGSPPVTAEQHPHPSLSPRITSFTPAPTPSPIRIPVTTAVPSPVPVKITPAATESRIIISGDPYQISTAGLEQRVHELINLQRTSHGLKALTLDPLLSDIARNHSEDMAARNYFSHVTAGGENPTDRGNDAGYTCRKDYGSYYTYGIAENIFQNNLYSSATYYSNGMTVYDWNSPEEIAQTTVSGWMNSTGHRENILTPSFDREGIGVAIAADSKVYITEDFC